MTRTRALGSTKTGAYARTISTPSATSTGSKGSGTGPPASQEW